MSEWDRTFDFNKKNVDASPAVPGVYCLLIGDETIYIGSSEVSIRSRLQRHFNGAEGGCTASATDYKRSPCRDPLGTEAAMLAQYKRANGRLPHCNEVMPRG